MAWDCVRLSVQIHNFYIFIRFFSPPPKLLTELCTQVHPSPAEDLHRLLVVTHDGNVPPVVCEVMISGLERNAE